MGLLYKPWPADDGCNASSDRERRSSEEAVEKAVCDDVADFTLRDDAIGTRSHRSIAEDDGLPLPKLPPRDGSLPRRDSSLLTDRHPLLGPFEKFPGTQFWEVYWHRKRMIKWNHWQLLTESMSVWEMHRCTMETITHHRNLLQSIEGQYRDGMAEGPLLYWLVGDHSQLLETSRVVLQYVHTIRIPLILAAQELIPPRQP